MTDRYGRDKEDRPLDLDPANFGVEDIDLKPEEPMDLTETLLKGREEALVKSLFRQIREHTVTEEDKEESRPNVSMHEEPPDLEDMEFEDWFVPSGCIRVDAEGRPLSMELLYDALEAAEREGNYPRDNGWEWWLHHEQLHNLRQREADTWWANSHSDEEYEAEAVGVPIRAFPVFPTGALLLIDPRVLEPVHRVGSRAAQEVHLTDPRRVVRVTSIGRE